MVKKNILDTTLYILTSASFKKNTWKRIGKYFLFSLAILLLTWGIIHRQQIFFSFGDMAFGGKIANHTFYNLEIAEGFFKLADISSERKPLWLNYQISRVNFIKGDFSQAIYFANKELELHPTNCRTHYIRGLTYAYMDRLDAAISDFEAFNTCFPDTWAGHNDLAWFWFRKGNMNKVIEVIEPSAQKYTTNAWVQNTYGVALMNLGRYQEAEKALLLAKESAAKMTPKDWGESYPGNDPSVYKKGLDVMRESIDANLKIIHTKKAIHK